MAAPASWIASLTAAFGSAKTVADKAATKETAAA